MGMDQSWWARWWSRRRRATQHVPVWARTRAGWTPALSTDHWRTLVLVGVTLAATGLVLFLGFRKATATLFTENPVFTIRNLDLSSDGRLTPELLQRYAELREGENLFRVSSEEIRQRLRSVPLVKDVQVRRQLPDTLEVRVVERTPLARIVVPGYELPLAVDAEGWIWIGDASTQALPQLTGFHPLGLRPGIRLAAPDLLDALALLSRVAKDVTLRSVGITRVHRRDAETFLLTLATGEEVLIPRRTMHAGLDYLPDILRRVRNYPRREGSPPVRIDMTGEVNYSIRNLLP